MKLSWRQSNRLRITVASMAVVGGVVMSLFNHWEISGETWGYWFFARVFAESGRFIIPDRSPLYTLYLNGFRWLGYPTSVTAEYLVTSFITVAAIVALFRRYLGLSLAAFAALLGIPFLQVAEPPVQKLAFACICLAIVARQTNNNRFRLAVSYALLGLAWMFRCTYLICIPIFLVWDVLQILRKKRLKTCLAKACPKFSDWPVVLVIGLLMWFAAMQSSHSWNNVWFGSTTYFPSEGKTMFEGNIQNYNWKYIEVKYGSFEGKDFYFTNQEAFDGASNSLGAIRANPQFIIEQIGRNIKRLGLVAAGLTVFPLVYSGFPPGLRYLALLVLAIILLYGAFRACRDKSMILFVGANTLLIGVTVIGIPKGRYMVPLIPILILSAFWYGTQARRILTMWQASKSLFWTGLIGVALLSLYFIFRIAFAPPGLLTLSLAVVGYVIALALVTIGRCGSKDTTSAVAFSLGCLAVPVALVFLSIGAIDWLRLVRNTANDVRHEEIRVMESPLYSMKASFFKLEPLVRDCKGVLVLESTFIGAFMNVPLDRIHDVWEIPPFGHLDDSVYDGLRPDRIDCVLVSHELATGIGCATNYQIRYRNYIKPYVEQLKDMGAKTHNIEGFGQAVILPKLR